MTNDQRSRILESANGGHLGTEDEMLLDALLDSPDVARLSEAVKSMSEDEVSLAWRSKLNERIATTASAKSRRGRSWLFRPALGLGLAGALALVILLPNSDPAGLRTAEVGLEERMAVAHLDAVNGRLISGYGISDSEALPTSAPVDGPIVWDESDLRGQ